MDDPEVKLLDFPSSRIKGVAVLTDDGTCMIYINARLSREEQLKVYEHELAHLRRNDFYNELPVTIVERGDLYETG